MSMKLDEAIAHAEHVADSYKDTASDCECAKDHRQLAAWLKELKEYRQEHCLTDQEIAEAVGVQTIHSARRWLEFIGTLRGLGYAVVKRRQDEPGSGLYDDLDIHDGDLISRRKTIAEVRSALKRMTTPCIIAMDAIRRVPKEAPEKICVAEIKVSREEIEEMIAREVRETLAGSNKDAWTPVSERLPEEEGDYLVTNNAGRVARFCFTGADSSKEYWRRCVLAWMPLPEPYKGGVQ